MSDLKIRSVQGGIATLISQVLKFIFRIGSVMVLARILTPGDYGLVAMVAVLTNFAMMFKDMGLSLATVQKAEITHEQISTLFWINVSIGLFLALLLCILSPVISWFYGKSELTLITMVLASTFIFSGLSIQHRALLRRKMMFTSIAVIEVVSLMSGILLAIIFAVAGAKYWALVIMNVVEAVINTILSWITCRWIPGRLHRGVGAKSMIIFGGNITGFNVLNYFSRNADNLLIGKFIGQLELGLYNRAYSLLTLPLDQIRNPITSIVIPTLSRLNNDSDRYRKVFLKMIRFTSLIMIPPVALLITTSDLIIDIILGPQWKEASSIFAWLGVMAVVQSVSSGTGWLFITQGRTKEMFNWGFFSAILCIASFIVGLKWGAVGVAASYSLSGLLLREPMALYIACKHGPVATQDYLKNIAPFVYIALSSTILILLLRMLANFHNKIFMLATSTGIILTVTSIFLISTVLGRETLAEFRDLISIFFSRRH